MVRYSFPVRLFHPLLHAGLSRRTVRNLSLRGTTSYWIELEFNDQRKKLKIAQSIEGYPALRDILVSVFTAKSQS